MLRDKSIPHRSKPPEAGLVDIAPPVDFIGINYYTPNVVRHEERSWPLNAAMVPQKGKTDTETECEVHARALTDLLLWFKDRYGETPRCITENGAAFYDPPVAGEEGASDPLRASNPAAIAAVSDAIAAGVDVRGYRSWSLLDKWSLCYSRRFGMVHVDFENQRRGFTAASVPRTGQSLDKTDRPEPARDASRISVP